MKYLLFSIFSVLFLSGAQKGFSQDIDLDEIVLLDRKYHIYVDSEEVLIYYNSRLTFKGYVENLNNGLSPIFSNHYKFNILEYSGDPTRTILNAGVVTVFEGSTEEIIESRLHNILTVSQGVLALVELGEPLVHNGDERWAYFQQEKQVGYYFHRPVFQEICSSFYFVPAESFYLPEEFKRVSDEYTAIFLITNTSEADICFEKLFIDLIGLRGLAVNTEASQQHIGEAVDALNLIENNNVFSENR